ncbi:MAG: hypothetical protein KDK05_06570 [Candidatus Competibacteraceae bacterium]|nr:hypothetical protein [Candidatus Competibacteraceae bacterium]
MTDLTDYATETEAARIVGVSAGKGVVWRHLREHAPHIELVELFGYTAVKKEDLKQYMAQKRGMDLRRRRLSLIRTAHRKIARRNGRTVTITTRRRCAVCGQWVSNRGLGWKWHMDSHRLGEKLDVGREIVEELAR